MNDAEGPTQENADSANAHQRFCLRIWLATVALLIVISLIVWAIIVQQPPWNTAASAKNHKATSAASSETVSSAYFSRRAPFSGYAASTPSAGSGIVWVNTRSRVYHYPGYRWYGTTRQGKYLRELDALSEGDRAALNERRPIGFGQTVLP